MFFSTGLLIDFSGETMEVKLVVHSSELQLPKRILSKLMQNLIFMCMGNVLSLVQCDCVV